MTRRFRGLRSRPSMVKLLRWVALLAVAALVLGTLTACAGGAAPAEPTKAPVAAEPTRAAAEPTKAAAEPTKAAAEPAKTGAKPVPSGGIKVCYADGFGGNNWRKYTKALFEHELTYYPQINKSAFTYTDANAVVDKAISDIRALTAQGCNIIVTLADHGPAVLPAVKEATAKGVLVVTNSAVIGGEPGKDYLAHIGEDEYRKGYDGAYWLATEIGAKKVVMIGGTPGNPITAAERKGALDAFEKAGTGTKLIDFADGYWDTNKTQQACAELITKNPDFDGVLIDYGTAACGCLRAFQAANREIPAFASEEGNLFIKMWGDLRKTNPKFRLLMNNARNFTAVLALQRALLEYGIEPRKTQFKDEIMKKPSFLKIPLEQYDADKIGFEKLYRPQYGADYPVLGVEYLEGFNVLPEEKMKELFPTGQ